MDAGGKITLSEKVKLIMSPYQFHIASLEDESRVSPSYLKFP